ncbi:hypothetical protein [Castellaniella sp. GW247-6E4]|uniref:hypothetical protein n=1 Tax=Castellaniella sp. GW247-6E4 TaxID=3140380 RepID=UPI0033146493
MAGLFGRGVLVNWGGVQAASEADYNAWHSLEHMPERLSVPGFRRGRRCEAVTGTPESLRYFMMYEADDPQVFVSAPYLARLNDPTPWTRRILSVYIAPSRTVCEVVASTGHGTGGWLATLQFGQGASALPGEDWLVSRMREVVGLPGILGAHVLRGDARLGQQPTAEKAFRESGGEPDRTVALALLIDGMNRARTQAALDGAMGALTDAQRRCAVATLYYTQHVLADADVAPEAQ